MPRSAARRLAAAVATIALAIGGGIAVGTSAAAAEDAALNAVLAKPWSEGSGVTLSGECPTGSLGAAVRFEGQDSIALMWPDADGTLNTATYTGPDPGETLNLALECYAVAYDPNHGFGENPEITGTATAQVTGVDHGSHLATAAEVSADQPIVVDFFCGPEGDNANVHANLMLFDPETEQLFAQVAAVAPGHPFDFGTPTGLGIAPGATVIAGLLCTATIDEVGDDITSQRYARILVTAAMPAPTPPAQVRTAASGR